MKFLYQQLLAFWALIMMVLLIVGLSFISFTRNSLEQSNYAQLYRYAQGIVNSSKTDPEMITSMKLSEILLANDQAQFFYVDSERNIIYPTSNSNQQIEISNSQWQEVASGTTTSGRNYLTNTRATDLLGSDITTSYIILPMYSQVDGATTFVRALVVSQPADNIRKAMIPFTENLIKGFIISSFAAVLLSYFLAQYQVKRINRLKAATKEIRDGNFDVQIETNEKSKSEFDELGEDFNRMAHSLKEYRHEVQEQEERRAQFMADASHEMRTPLTTINGLLEGLSHNAIPPERKEKALHLMENETKRLIRLVNENLDYEKIRTNQISMMVKAFSGKEVLEGIVTQMTEKAAASGNQLVLAVHKDATIYADPDRFVQVLVNIIQNAIQFTTDGTITIDMTELPDGVKISVKDTGIGMTPEQQKNIWDRYYKVDPSRKNTKYGESGLGLPIVKQIMLLHGGTIALDSTLNKGTTFTLFFPNKEPQAQ